MYVEFQIRVRSTFNTHATSLWKFRDKSYCFMKKKPHGVCHKPTTILP